MSNQLTLTEQINDLWNKCEKERMLVVQNARNEADKWKKEDDMYGWNFHQGIASGTIEASFIYNRVFGKMKELLHQLQKG